MDLIDSNVTLDDLFEWLKKEIENGKYQHLKTKTDEELLDLVTVAKPLIEIELSLANAFAWEQVNSIKKNKINT